MFWHQLQQICSALEFKPGPVWGGPFCLLNTSDTHLLPLVPSPQVPKLAQKRLCLFSLPQPWGSWGAGGVDVLTSPLLTGSEWVFHHGIRAVGEQPRLRLETAAQPRGLCRQPSRPHAQGLGSHLGRLKVLQNSPKIPLLQGLGVCGFPLSPGLFWACCAPGQLGKGLRPGAGGKRPGGSRRRQAVDDLGAALGRPLESVGRGGRR